MAGLTFARSSNGFVIDAREAWRLRPTRDTPHYDSRSCPKKTSDGALLGRRFECVNEFPKRAREDQLWVKVAASVIGAIMVMERGLSVPEYEPEPLPAQLVKL